MTMTDSRAAILLSLRVGLPKMHGTELHGSAKTWTSGILKPPVDGPVWLGARNLEGDRQADLVHHGGVDKAVCVNSADHSPFWRRELGQSGLQGGAFGENFTVAGLTERDICIGDIWEIGEALVPQPASWISRWLVIA